MGAERSPLGWFVTGTDTEVGKTAITALLATALRNEGEPVQALKPLASGSGAPGDDARRLGRAAGHPPRVWRCLPLPRSPARAAAEAGVQLHIPSMLAWIRQHPAPWLVEGVGGFRVPLAPGWDVRRLAVALDLPVVIVAANRLGVLSHTLLTVDAVRAAGLPVVGVVLNCGAPHALPLDSAPARWNQADLQAELPGVPVHLVPPLTAARRRAAGRQLLAALTAREPVPRRTDGAPRPSSGRCPGPD